MGYLVWVGPAAWGAVKRRKLMEAFADSVAVEPVQVGEALEASPVPHPGFPDDPEAARALAKEHPLVIAAVERRNPRLLVRQGDTFTVETGTPRSARLLAWAREADPHRAEGRWDPPLAPEEPPTFLLMDPAWTWVVQWRSGSPEAEAFLRLALGPHPKVRAGLARTEIEARPGSGIPVPPIFRPPNLQTCMEGPEAPWTVVWTGTVLGPHWESIFQPWPEQAQAWEAQVRRRTWLARLAGLGALALLALGLFLRRRTQRREALEADRLAALTHSLKTPLAIHKLRCDSLRMGLLPPAKAAEELMRLGQEVDELTRLIERGLLARQAGLDPQGLDRFGPAWLEDVAEGLRPALDASGRRLELDLAAEEGQAHPPSLQSALLTLLENAYHHGKGTITLRSRPRKGSLRIEVDDQGPGLDIESLEALGRPFQRLRAGGEEGFRHEGQGLGLSLLLQVARQEGWGLELSSAPGEGFSARIEVPLAPPDPA